MDLDELLDQLDVVSSKNNNDHVCQDVTKDPRSLSFRGGLKDIKKYYEIVVTNNPVAKQFCDNCGFSSAFEFDFTNGDRGLVEAIAERWWKSTRSFHFPEFEIGLLPVDWYMITGIPTGDPSKLQVVVPQLANGQTWSDIDDLYFSDIRTHGTWDHKTGIISLGTLAKYMDSRKDQDNIECAVTLTRAFFMWCFGHFLVSHSTGKVHKRWVLLLHDLDRVGEYDWGLASLGNTYRYLDEWSTSGKNIVGMAVVLEYWYYYYFRNMQPLLCQGPQVHLDVFPKICLFLKIKVASRKRGHKGGQKDTMKHSVKSARLQIDTRTTEACIWQPWIESQFAVGEEYEYALQVSKRRLLFFDFQAGTRASCYLWERFQRQITGDIVVPRNPPSLESIDVNDFAVEVNDYYVVSEDQYNIWWKKKSVGPYNTITYRAQNVDEIAVGSSSIPRGLYPSQPASDMFSQTFIYPTQNEPPSRLPQIDFTLPFANEAGVEEQILVPKVPCPFNFREMNLTMEDCYRYMENSASYQLGVRQASWEASYKLISTSCSSSSRSTSSSVPSTHPPNTRNEEDLTLGGTYDWNLGGTCYTPVVEDGATTSQTQQGGNDFTAQQQSYDFTALLTESEPNIVYDTQPTQQQSYDFFRPN